MSQQKSSDQSSDQSSVSTCSVCTTDVESIPSTRTDSSTCSSGQTSGRQDSASAHSQSNPLPPCLGRSLVTSSVANSQPTTPRPVHRKPCYSHRPTVSLSEHHFVRASSVQYQSHVAIQSNRWPVTAIRTGHLIQSQYLVMGRLGKGAFAMVLRAKDVRHRKDVALKIFTKINHFKVARAEIEIFELIRTKSQSDGTYTGHPFIVQLHQHFHLNHQWFLVFEHLSLNLYDYMEATDFRPFDMALLADVTAQLCSAVDFLHHIELIHTDIKPDNVVFVYGVSRDGQHGVRLASHHVKLIDLGLARTLDDTYWGTVTTRYYRAPEIILKLDWSWPIDIWSVACTLYEIYKGTILFDTLDRTCSNLEHIYLISCVIGPFPKSMRYNLPDYFRVIDRRLRNKTKFKYDALDKLRRNVPGDHLFFDLLHQMLQLQPDTRITGRHAAQHAFVHQYCTSPEFVHLFGQ